ncbi:MULTISPECIES: hypothetical protein [Cyanophyceae]|uniref:hypothetical protein n=1 Tax=Cyanophyceae TaxID=3028117 RepID=UPI001686F6E8|nr:MULTISPECIES: hypothetical protein [Cyanophyceae]MBD1918842.1 hypothetical protein [Phormidium sp. FACHB-77]MBD2033315.1 hypothetical protein [Phormidium sp. FACHB-322]MBD2053752.1 hypothetical protein [Leptolyngbya sp. FACHB-60]
MPQDPEEFIADMHGLKGDIEQLLFALATNEPEDIAAAQRDVLATLESCAVIHTGIVSKTLKEQRNATRKMGLRQISVPISFTGNWVVLPEKARQAL